MSPLSGWRSTRGRGRRVDDLVATVEQQRADLETLRERVDGLVSDLRRQVDSVERVRRDASADESAVQRRASFYSRPGFPSRSVVIGLGTGRSGTVSLARLLDAQRDAAIGHESKPLLPWQFDRSRADFRVWQLEHHRERLVGDVAYYYLPYVEYLASVIPHARFVCLRRDRDDVVASMLRKTPRTNLWADHDGSTWDLDPVWDPTMPSYPPMPKRAAIERYWDEYYLEAERLQRELGDRFRVFDMDRSLNTEVGVDELLDFVQVEDRDRVSRVGIIENRTVEGRPT